MFPVVYKTPFPHVVVESEWSTDLLHDVASEFPAYDDPRWIEHPDPKEKGKKQGGPEMWGAFTKLFITHLRSKECTDWLSELFGIPDLVADTIGGGMHLTGPGGRLDMHVDFNRHPSLPGMVRRLNLLVFLNERWHLDWGGNLVLEDGANGSGILIGPTFNRTVIFETSAQSWHGHPDPIVGDHYRKSIAVYYWGPEETAEGAIGSTVWKP